MKRYKVTITIGGDGYGNKCCGEMDCDDQPCTSCGAFDDYEEDGPMDLEDQLERALDAAFPAAKEVRHE